MIWEALVPLDFLTTDYFMLIGANGIEIINEYFEAFGNVPFRETAEEGGGA